MTKTRLLLLSFSPLVDDARVRKQVSEFATDFHVITCGYGPALTGVAEHFQLDEAWSPWQFNRTQLITRQYTRAYWGNAAVSGAQQMLAGRSFDVIVANDYETVPLALSLRPEKGVLADLHEYAPSQRENLLRWRVFVAPFRQWLCRTYLPECAATTTVADRIAARYAREFGVEPVVVRNATPKAELHPTEVHTPLRLVHHGVARRDRNLEVMIDAAINSTTHLTFDLYLVDSDRAYFEELKAKTDDWTQICVQSAVPYEDLVTTLNKYDVGVFSLPPVTYNYKMALPNKIFDYVQARLGVIVGPSPEMAALVRRYKIGAIAKDFTAASLTSLFDRLTPADAARWKKNSAAAAEELHADAETQKWRTQIERLVGS